MGAILYLTLLVVLLNKPKFFIPTLVDLPLNPLIFLLYWTLGRFSYTALIHNPYQLDEKSISLGVGPHYKIYNLPGHQLDINHISIMCSIGWWDLLLLNWNMIIYCRRRWDSSWMIQIIHIWAHDRDLCMCYTVP